MNKFKKWIGVVMSSRPGPEWQVVNGNLPRSRAWKGTPGTGSAVVSVSNNFSNSSLRLCNKYKLQ